MLCKEEISGRGKDMGKCKAGVLTTLKTYGEVLLLFKLFPEKYESQEKNIYGASYRRMCLYFLPGFFHFLTPMNIVKNENAIIIFF